MIAYSKIGEKLEEYKQKYRRPGLPELKLSALYSLYPEKALPNDGTVEGKWPDDEWPNANSKGIYIILGEDKDVLYVGKASMSNTIGARLGSYFEYAEDRKTCRVKSDGWDSQPHYVLTIGVQDELHFEAAAIEEFLIAELNPPENTVGKT